MKHAALLLLVLLAPGAAAQAECTRAEPCLLRVTLDGGVWFDAPGDHEATVQQHHWYNIDVFNQDERDHTLTLGNHTFLAPGQDGGGPRSRHGPVPFPDAGNRTLRDETAGAEATIRVEAGAPLPEDPEGPEPAPPVEPDAPAQPDPHDPPDRRKDVPAPLVVPLAALLLAVLRRR